MDRGLVILSAVQWRVGFLWIKILRFGGSLATTTTAKSTATVTTTATAERLFETLRVYCSVILSTDRGLVVLRFCKEIKSLKFVDSVVDRQRKGSLRLYGLTTWGTLA